MAHVSHKLAGSIEAALAGGGDPATSPLYVFGPFLRLLLLSGAAAIVFGAAIWLAVLTVLTVSAIYRLVMIWVTDGSGGSGLNEEEFGSWAVKVNAGGTVVEYTLTLLVSIAALVTFMADRFPICLLPHASGRARARRGSFRIFDGFQYAAAAIQRGAVCRGELSAYSRAS